ncbi:hypothetical protein [Streptomyces sp. NPDC102462]|uniref:hypothetical protein n=1 Tax=Streptomyces sp. NPDC102462 TaxID=3366178 RepID=UPI003819B0F8
MAFAGIVGSYITAASVHATWAFWLVGGGALTYATVVVLIPRGYKRSVEYTNRITNYPRLLEINAKMKEEKEHLLAELIKKSEEEGTEYERGVREGIRKAGGIVGAYSTETPKLTGVMKESGGVVLIAKCSGRPPQPGARYLVILKLSNSIKGIVEVRSEGHSSKSVHLVCVSVLDDDFWLTISEKAELEEDLPPSVALARYRLKDGEEMVHVTEELNEEPVE